MSIELLLVVSYDCMVMLLAEYGKASPVVTARDGDQYSIYFANVNGDILEDLKAFPSACICNPY